MNDIKKLLASLPDHGDLGMFGNPRAAPLWEARYGAQFTTDFLQETARSLLTQSIEGVEWGDVRARYINAAWGSFIEYVVQTR